MKPPPTSALGARERQRELSTYRRAGVHHSQETRGTHKTDTKRKKRGEQKEEEIQLTRHQTHYKAVKRQSTPPPPQLRGQMKHLFQAEGSESTVWTHASDGYV